MLQKERDQILNASAEDIHALAEIIEAVLAADQICVVGSESKVAEASDVLMEVKPLINCCLLYTSIWRDCCGYLMIMGKRY